MSDASIALHRFGLGARAGEEVPADPRTWLVQQIGAYRAPLSGAGAGDVPGSAAVAAQLAAFYDQQRALREQYGPRKALKAAAATPPAPPANEMGAAPLPPPMNALAPASGAAAQPVMPDPFADARKAAARQARQDYAVMVAARATSALTTTTPFIERMVHFWANHFAVSADKLQMVGLAGTLEFEAIRPHVLGSFADMLNAVERHPAMLLYLDQAVSIGPDSEVGRRIGARGKRKVGLNENLAREIMELHTLGVRTGYTQADVTEFARALTGWTVAGIGRGPGGMRDDRDAPGTFRFVANRHEPGDRTIRGKAYPAGGEAQAAAVLNDLAADPATARHIATKLARHIGGDTPPPAMVDRLTAVYLRSGGDLPTLYRALIDSPEAWRDPAPKFRTPWEWTIASFRALGVTTVRPAAIVGLLNQLGQPTWKPGQPVGYDDIAGSWAGPDAVMRRVEAAERLATRAQQQDARALAPRLFPAALSPATSTAIARAESPSQALALLLVSPEMMRR